tara:strand:+ start:25806 stop:26348 length:543 start_codon:yes stop_codon:yes gene_type:complete
MMFLFGDTETTGFPSNSRKADDPKQARLVQLAAQLVTADNRTVMEFSLIINPGVPIPEAASNVHGITDEIAQKYGVSEATAVDFFLNLRAHCDADVFHNAAFDRKIMSHAIERRGKDGSKVMAEVKSLCTMLQVKGKGHQKANLAYCMREFFDEDHALAHDAMADTVACRRVFFHLNPTT